MKTKRTNKLLALLLTLVMVITMLPMTALAADETMDANALQSAIDSVENGGTITLTGNVTLANDTPLKIENKGSVEQPITLDLNGYTITGSNSQTGTTATSGEGKEAGILWISQSQVILTDASANEVKGGIVNASDKDSAMCGILLTAPKEGNPTSLVIENGVRVEIENGKTKVRPLCIYSPSDSAPKISLTVHDVAVKTSGYVLNPTSKANASIVVNGGIFETTASKFYASSSAFDYTTINGGTFSGAFSYSLIKSSVTGNSKAAVYAKNEEGKIITTITDTPAFYAAHISDRNGDKVYPKVYLASGNELSVLAEAGMLVADATIEIKETISCTYPDGKAFGSATGSVSKLTLNITDGATLSGSMPLNLAEVTVTGGGQVADNFFTASDSENFELKNSGNVYSCSLKSDKVAAKLTTASGKVSVYTSVAAAVNSAKGADGTFDIFTDYITGAYFASTGNLTLNLNGNEWTYTGNDYAFRPYSSSKTLTIKNGTVVANANATAAVMLGNSSTPGHLIISGDAVIKGNTVFVDKDGSTLTVYGTIDTTGTGNSAIMGNGSSTKNSTITIKEGATVKADVLAIYSPQNGILNIEGGSISGNSGIEMRGGELNITGGEVTATGQYVVGETPSSGGSTTNGVAVAISPYADRVTTANITGGMLGGGENGKAFALVTATDIFAENLTSKPDVSIIGGTFNGEVANDMKNSGGESAEVDKFIFGGSFSDNVDSFVVSGAVVQQQPDGTYSIVRDSAVDAVASIGNAGYAMLKEAIAAAKDNAVIVLLKDIPAAEGITVASGKKFTIDFNGHTYTLAGPGAGSTKTETNGFQLLKDSTIVFKNGTINIAPNAVNIKRIIQNYANLTLENMRIEAKNQVGGEAYVLSFNNGNVVFKGNTTIVTTSGDTVAFDVCNYASYPNVSVTFDDSYTGTINGRIMYDGKSAETAKLEINGDGTFGGIDLEKRVTTGNSSFKPNIQITGGSFNESVIDYVAESLKYEVKSTNTFTYHPTLADAIAAATDPNAVITAVKSDGETSEASKDTLTIDYDYDGKLTVIKVPAGEEIGLPVPENRSGYTFNGWYNGADKVTAYTGSANGNAAVTITAKWTKNSSSSGGVIVTDHTLTFDTNGGSEISKVTKSDGTVIDLADYTPTKEGYDFAGWYSNKALTEKVISVKLTKNTTVYAKWTEKVIELPFTDVNEKDWFYDDVAFVFENGMMKGISDTPFAPHDTTTRGMIVTILYRLEGKPTVSGNCPFNDVTADSWYEEAVAWAAANNIAGGYGNGKFGPEDTITREQMAAILYRYAEYKGYDVTDKANLSKFEDKNGISAWAQTALSWANADGLIEGDGDKLMPKENARRCQVAAILMRFCQNIVK